MSASSPACTLVMYHYIRDAEKTPYPGIKGLSIDKFRSQLGYIAKNYEVVGLDDYASFLRAPQSRKLPAKSAVLTFDDGLRDHYEAALPLMKSMGLTGAFFIVTQTLTDGEVPFVQKTHFLISKLGSAALAREINERLRCSFPELADAYRIDDGEKKDPSRKWDDNLTANLKWAIAAMPEVAKAQVLSEIFSKTFPDKKKFCRELYLGRDEIREMRAAGMSIGSHSHTHPMLGELPAADQALELTRSKAILEDALGAPVTSISYPYGSQTDETVAAVRKAGYACALLDTGGVNQGADVDAFRIRRVDTNELPFS